MASSKTTSAAPPKLLGVKLSTKLVGIHFASLAELHFTPQHLIGHLTMLATGAAPTALSVALGIIGADQIVSACANSANLSAPLPRTT